jgi:phosphoribosyl 1,2-cyclic phosphate phosphodiesterase
LGMERLGPSLFVHDEAILFDTPEEIAIELERAGIEEVRHIFYTHWHPDHTLGARICEVMNTAWSDELEWRLVPKSKTVVHAPGVIHDELMERLGVFFDFWQKVGVVEVDRFEGAVEIGKLQVEPVILRSRHRTITHTAIYVVTDDKSKVIYAPCDVTPFPEDERFRDADLLIIEVGWWGERMAERARRGPHYEISMEEVLSAVKSYEPKSTVLTHIGDKLEMTLSDLRELEEMYRDLNISFAKDGLGWEL